MRKYFYGDFYPLLSFSLAADAWAVWQYDRPDLGEGMVVAFRRFASPFAACRLTLQGLDPGGGLRNVLARRWLYVAHGRPVAVGRGARDRHRR